MEEDIRQAINALRALDKQAADWPQQRSEKAIECIVHTRLHYREAIAWLAQLGTLPHNR